MTTVGSAAALRAELEAIGVRPTKALGQNFLFDPNLARAIVADAGVEAGDRVLEVGPGCGFLTLPLAERGAELLVVEIDERLLELTRRRLGETSARFLHTDVLAGKHRLARSVQEELWSQEPWHLVANLPYGVSGPLLAILAGLENRPRSMTVLVQEEVAQRLCASPGDGAFGALTVRLQLHYRTRLGREVGAHLFWPRPRVASRIAHLEAVGEGPAAGASPAVLAAFERLVEGLFQRRRKTLRAGLAAVLGDREWARASLEEAGIDPGLRPEALGAERFLALAGVVAGGRRGA